MSDRPGTSFFSPRRAGIIALSTVTQLVRMKVFYFLAPIALLFVGLQFFDVFWYEGPEASQPQQELMMHKNLCLGTMMLFSSLFAIVSTALLIPGDIEDRTLYTILCKPVPRLDYLVGKLLGVISVIFVAMLVMDILMVVTLHYRTQAVSAELGEYLGAIGWGEEEVRQGQAEVVSHGPSLILQYGVLAHFFKASIIAAVALLISTFSTSTLFTIASSVMIWIIGAVQSLAREGLFTKGEYGVEPGMVDRILGTIISLVFPDFQLFESVSDGAARVMEIGVFDMLHLGGLTFFYIAPIVPFSFGH